MKTIYRYIVLCSLILFQGCKDEDIPDCGCNSRTKYTVPSPLFSEVPDEEQTNGFIIYKDQMTEDDRLKDSQFDNRFWIIRNNYQHKFIVCNEGELTSKFDFLKESQTRDTVAIKFTGNTKYMCTEPFIGYADFEYAEIQLTSIEKIIN